jgi:hypothetical protein
MPDLLRLSLKAAFLPLRIAALPITVANKAADALIDVLTPVDGGDGQRFTATPTEAATATKASAGVRAGAPSPTADPPAPPRRPAATRAKAPRSRSAGPQGDPIVTPRPKRKPTKKDAREEGDLTAAEAARRRESLREQETDEDSPGAEVHVEGTPWPGFEKQSVDEILTRLIGADDATKAVVRMYETLNDRREAILAATEQDADTVAGTGDAQTGDTPAG